MDRRGFLSMLGAGVAGVALDAAIPFNRVWSFPQKLVLSNVWASYPGKLCEPTPKQSEFINLGRSPDFEVYGGARGDGKLSSHYLLHARTTNLKIGDTVDVIRGSGALRGRVVIKTIRGHVIGFDAVPANLFS